MKKIKFILLISLGLFILYSCDKTKEIWVCYDETYCADPWRIINDSDSLTEIQIKEQKMENIENYFRAKNVELKNLAIRFESVPQECNACNCLSGNVICCKIEKEDFDIMEEEGFYRCYPNK